MEDDQCVSVGEWVVTLLWLCIPILNLVLIICWAIGARKESKRNFFRAQIILLLLVFGAVIAIATFAPGLLPKLK